MNFSKLKKSSSDLNSRLLKEVEKLSSPQTYENEEASLYWKPTPDKSGNALAVIRFLPGPEVDGDEALPWVRYFDHGFQNKTTGRWYIEKSLTTIDKKDPVSEYNSMLWNSSQDDNGPERKQARDQKRRLHYVSNIYIVSDPKNPENEGKVFLFKYGKKIFDKITKMMNPDLESEAKVNPFDLWKGANFKLKVTRQTVNLGGRQVSFPNYDESVFLAPAPLSEDDSEMENIWKSEHSLAKIISAENFKDYDVLKKRLEDVLGLSGDVGYTPTAKEEVPFTESKPVAKKAAPPAPASDEEDDPDIAMFNKWVNEDE